MENDEVSLFERLGGSTAIAVLLDTLYARVYADAALAPFFKDVAPEKLRYMQLELFSAALGGPVTYTGPPIVHAHQHLNISLVDFQRSVAHLLETLQEQHLSDRSHYEIIGRLNPYTNDVVSARLVG